MVHFNQQLSVFIVPFGYAFKLPIFAVPLNLYLSIFIVFPACTFSLIIFWGSQYYTVLTSFMEGKNLSLMVSILNQLFRF
jgi:hypothetical protein